MESTDTTPINKEGFIARVMEIDNKDKFNLLNGVQYVALSIVPIAVMEKIIHHFFDNKHPEEKGSIELLVEIMAEFALTLILIFGINKVIVEIPTYSDTPMTRINYTTLAIGILVSRFASGCDIRSKLDVLIHRTQDLWEGKTSQDSSASKTSARNNHISVSQPNSGRPATVPTHQASRADYLSSHQQLMPPATQQRVSPPQEPDITSQQMYGGPANSLISAQEPMAANESMANYSLGASAF